MSIATNVIDSSVGKQVQTRRLWLGLGVNEVSEQIGVSRDRLELYESGKCRIDYFRLCRLSKVLAVNVGFFYAGIDEEPFGPFAHVPFEDPTPHEPVSDAKRLTFCYALMSREEARLSASRRAALIRAWLPSGRLQRAARGRQ